MRESLAAAMRTVMRTLADRSAAPVALLRGLRPGDLGWMVQRHAEVYAREHGWSPSFESFVARIVADYLDHHRPDRESAWMAELDGQRAGCVLCVRTDDPETAQLRVLLVEAWAADTAWARAWGTSASVSRATAPTAS